MVNITNFQFLINNDICGAGPVSFVFTVHSAVGNKEMRDTVRAGWGGSAGPGAGAQLAFLLGTTPDPALQATLTTENSIHGDLVQGGFTDTYANLSYKTVMGAVWVGEFCPQAEFMVKTDDDMFVDVWALHTVTRPQILASPSNAAGQHLLCAKEENIDYFCGTKIVRNASLYQRRCAFAGSRIEAEIHQRSKHRE